MLEENPFILAPMHGITDLPFRELCEKEGACYTISELTSARALTETEFPKHFLKRGDLKTNCLQLFGSQPSDFVKAVKKVEDYIDIIDINLGCPSKDILKTGSGADLLDHPEKISNIIKELKKNTDKPITAKIRLGNRKINYLENAKEIEKAGASLLTIHGRTTKQGYSGKADWKAIKEIYNTLTIPVIGNGDITKEEDINLLGKYCDGLMIGRKSIGNPFIFKRLLNYYKHGKKLPPVTKIKQKNLLEEYMKKLKDYRLPRETTKCRQQSMWFLSGFEGSRELRKQLSTAKTTKEIEELTGRF